MALDAGHRADQGRDVGVADPAPEWPEPCEPRACRHQHVLATLRRDLHDQVGSTLAGLIVSVEVLERLIGVDPARAHRVLADAGSDLGDLAKYVRRLAAERYEQPPHPARGAMDRLIARMNRLLAGKPVITLDVEPDVDAVRDGPLWTAFWIIREAMTNVLKHAHARNCAVSVAVRDGQLYVRVEDDGVGIHPGAHRRAGRGLANMTARARARGGGCRVDPVHPSGVAVVAVLPLDDFREDR